MVHFPRRISAAVFTAAMLLVTLTGGAAPANAEPDQPCQSCASGTNPGQPNPPGGSAAGGGQKTVGGGGKMGQAPPAKPSAPVNH